MAGQNVAGHVNAAYQNIIEGVTETLNQSVTSRKLFQDYKWSGTHIEHVLHTGRSGAVSFTADGGAFPSASKQSHIKMKVGRKIMQASIKLTDAVLNAAAKSPEVAIDAMTSESEGIMKDIGVLDSFFSYRDGTGAVATLQTGSGTGLTTNYLLVDDARLLWPGVSYDIYTSGGTYVETFAVSGVNPLPNANGFMEVNSSAAVSASGYAATNIIYWKDSKGLVYSGLDSLIDDATSGTFQNVTMSNAYQWLSLVLENSGTKRDLSPTIMRNFIAGMSQRGDENAAGMKEYVVVGSKFMTNVLDAMYESAYRLSPDSNVLGIAAPAFQCSAGKIAVKGERLAPYHKLFACEAGDLRRGYHKKLSWRLQGGEVLLRSDDNASWSGTLIEFAENFIMKRKGCGKIIDLNETVVVSD